MSLFFLLIKVKSMLILNIQLKQQNRLKRYLYRK